MSKQLNSGSGRETPEFIKSKGGSGALPGFEGMQEHWHQTSKGSNLHFFTNAEGVGPADGPVLTLAHGWPQTSYIFRYLIPALQQRIRLFVPDQPGIAHSSVANAADKLTLGTCYMEALVARFGKGTKVVLSGHDRGARIMHRVAVSRALFPDVEVLGAVFMDIVPIAAQFQAFGVRPANTVRCFHWSFMPMSGLAVPMITAFGGDKWCRAIHDNSGSSNEEGLRRMRAGDAVDVYSAWYAREDVIQASVEEYTAAANEDYDAMIEDQKNGRKVDVPLLVLHGVGLGLMNGDVSAVWADYVADPSRLEVCGAGNGYGHYLAEECPEWTTKHIEDFLKSLGL